MQIILLLVLTDFSIIFLIVITQILIYYFMVRLLIIGAYIGSSFMVHGDCEPGLENLKEVLKDLDYINKLTH